MQGRVKNNGFSMDALNRWQMAAMSNYAGT
jgi:hypothetical protein